MAAGAAVDGAEAVRVAVVEGCESVASQADDAVEDDGVVAVEVGGAVAVVEGVAVYGVVADVEVGEEVG